MRGRVFVALMLVTASLGAMVVDAQRPASEEATTLKESQCYLCHSEGGGSLGPPLPLLYLIHGPSELRVPVGEKVTLEVGIENAWVSELLDIVAIADVTNAPGLVFSSDKAVEPAVETGTIPVEAAPGERSTRTNFIIHPGASDFTVTLETDPSTNAQLAGDWILRVWSPSQNPARDAPLEINEAGAGQPEVFVVNGAQEVTSQGVGTWTADIVVAGISTTSPLGSTEQGYQLTTVNDFKSTGEPRQFTGTSDVLISRVEAPGQLAYVEWTILAESMPTEPATLPVEVVLVAYYAHGSTQISQYDEWRYTKTLELQVVPDPGTGEVIVRANSVAEIPFSKAGFAWDIFSEILGYISAVLILASVYTGGMFGKASRRQLNSVFGTAKRRVAFHNFLSYGIVLAAVAHMIVFLIEPAFDWTLGIIWGGIAILTMFGLGVTGAIQVPMIRKWNYSVWRWSHFYLAIGSIVFTIVHILLDGVHFTDFQDAIGWANPFTSA